MGYQTDFTGEINIVPPLNPHEISYLSDFASSRRMDRVAGPYSTEEIDPFGREDPRLNGPNGYNTPPYGQPGLWCQWVSNEDGTGLVWDKVEKFYNADAWMFFVINTFLKPGATLQSEPRRPDWKYPDAIGHFTFDHVLNGVITAAGEDPDDRWLLVVRNNVVEVHRPPTLALERARLLAELDGGES